MAKKKKDNDDTPQLTEVNRPEDYPGIQKLVWIDNPEQLKSNPNNWRKHPKRQTEALLVSIQENGWAGAALYNEVTGRLIDGHARKEVTMEKLKNLCPIPVLVGRWTEEQERRLLISLDPISAMAEVDSSKLKALTEKVGEELASVKSKVGEDDKRKLEKLMEDLQSSYVSQPTLLQETETPGRLLEQLPTNPTTDPEVANEVLPVFDLMEVGWFELGQTPYDIPLLRSEMLSDCPEPLATWTAPDSSPKDSPYYITALGNGNCFGLPFEQTVLCTHVGDDVLDDCWRRQGEFTKTMLKRKYYAAITPEFSVGNGYPKAWRIFNVFRNRQIGRFWQEAEIKVIPSVSHIVYQEDIEFLFAGVPQNAPCLSVQMQSHTISEEEKKSEKSIKAAEMKALTKMYNISLNTLVTTLKPQSLLVYGGKMKQEVVESANLPSSLHVIYANNFSMERFGFLKNRRVRQA